MREIIKDAGRRRLVATEAALSAAVLHTGTQVELTRKLGVGIAEGALKTVLLTPHFQSVRTHEQTPALRGHNRRDTVQLLCPAKECPAVSPCTGMHSRNGDPRILSCWNPDLEDRPIKERPRPLWHFHRWNLGHNSLDICLPNVTGMPGETVRPRCPWQGDSWEGKQANTDKVWKDGWAGQVFVLNDVFLDGSGRVFNATHRFDAGGCHAPSEESYSSSTKVTDVEEAVNLLAAAAHRFSDAVSERKTSLFHTTVYELPLLLPVMRVLPKMSKAIVATRNKKFHRMVSTQVTAKLPWDAMIHSIAAPAPGSLWFVKRLVQPIFQACQQPSPSLWRRARAEHFLPRQMKAEAAKQVGATVLVPPSMPVLLKGWIVVVHVKALGVMVKGSSMKAILEQFFPEDRLVMYPSGSAVKDWEVFNRAGLFITVGHAAMANVIFMPPNATVLQLRSYKPASRQDPDSNLAVALAEACEVRSFISFCDQTGDYGPLTCDRHSILDVVDRASLDIYTAHKPPPVRRAGVLGLLSPKSASWFKKSASAARQVEAWSQCVVTKGKWVYNPTPRILPWEYTGFMNLCDHRHVQAGGLGSRKADELASSGASAKEWNVRETLKYEWKVPQGSCPGSKLSPQGSPFSDFSGPEFCQNVGKGRTFLFMGDSLSDQFTAVFLNNMLKHIPKPASWAISEEIPQECIDWLPPNGMVPHTFCRDIRFHKDVCPGMRLIFVRSDYLLLGNLRAFDVMQFTRFSFLKDVDVAVVNRGAHYEPTVKYARDLEAFFRYFRNRFPQMLMVYRNTPPGHTSCEKVEKPLVARQDPSSLPFNWGDFKEQNAIAKDLVKRHDYVYMDVDTMTALRADGHKGMREDNRTDCLHYCTPGPLDVWSQHFFNTMLWANPLELVAGQNQRK